MTRLILASASPARLRLLRSAGIDPEVRVSGVDEDGVTAESPLELARALASLKARTVAADVPVLDGEKQFILGCDSVFEFDGQPYGKPADETEARRRWQQMRGGEGILHTGHCLMMPGDPSEFSGVLSTVVRFARDISDAEIEAYVATGEPLRVAGGFTLDGLGGAFVAGVEGDPLNVIGLSVALLREYLAGYGVQWTDLWADPADL